MNGKADLEILKQPQERKIVSYFSTVLVVVMIGQKRGGVGNQGMFILEHFEINKPHNNFFILNFFITVVTFSLMKKCSGNGYVLEKKVTKIIQNSAVPTIHAGITHHFQLDIEVRSQNCDLD